MSACPDIVGREEIEAMLLGTAFCGYSLKTHNIYYGKYGSGIRASIHAGSLASGA
jgi:hypothetical protein